MSEGHNGGPPAGPLTPSMKLECIKSLLDRSDLTAAQKCTGAGIIANADREWICAVTTADLLRYSSAKDRETVFRATRALDEKRIVAKASVRGQSGRYTVLPPSVVAAVIDAYVDMKSGRGEADHSFVQGGRVKPDGISGRVPTTEPVGFDRTGPVKPVGFDPTSRDKPDHSRASAPARKESPSGINIFNNNNQLPPPPEQEAARSGGGYDPEFQELNGSAIQLVEFIGRAANVDEKTSRQMLKTNIQIFGKDAMLEAFVSCQAEMATGLVANPYKYLIGVAKKAKADREGTGRNAKARRGVDPQILKAQNEMLRREYGFDKE